jgi:hypothetical protein
VLIAAGQRGFGLAARAVGGRHNDGNLPFRPARAGSLQIDPRLL